MVILDSISDPRLPALLLAGKVGVIPTDTVYGLVAAAANPDAAERLYQLKQRQAKPGTVIAASVEQLISLGVPKHSLDMVAHLWPNPLSIELDIGPELAQLHQGTGHCSFRVVAAPELSQLLVQTGPLLTSSANRPADPPAVNISQAQACFKDAVDFYVDGGDLSGRQPSTVARFADGRLVVVRQGSVVIDK
jgi:L-threonylcarbamoyladenylate synthase